MIKNCTIITLIIFLSCSLYEDTEQPDIYFQINDFDMLPMGRTISDMMMGPNNNFLYLCDYNNNSMIKISAQGTMKIIDELVVGSHPIAMDISPDKSHIAVAMEGESNVYLISLEDFTISTIISVSLMNMNDIVYVNSNRLLLSSTTDPTVITYDIDSDTESSQSILNGELLIDQEDSIAYVASSSSIKKIGFKRFFPYLLIGILLWFFTHGSGIHSTISGVLLACAIPHKNSEKGKSLLLNLEHSLSPYVADPFGFSATINHFIINDDILYVCLNNKEDSESIRSIYSYNANTLTFAGKYQVGSPGLGVVVDTNNERIFIAPQDADENGVFIIEFDAQTKLEKNYYLAAGNLKEKCMVIDQTSSYIYILVNTPGDNDSFEPYNDYPFDLQRIEIYN